MPTVTENTIEAWASCRDGRCPGYKQERAQAVRTLTEFSYFDLGGDIPGIERSTDLLRFADVDDEPCPVCGEPRLIADQVRPIYPNVSGIPQDALLQVGRDSERIANMQIEGARRDAQMAQMESLMQRQAAALERQETQIAELSARPRGPGRPRKAEPEDA